MVFSFPKKMLTMFLLFIRKIKSGLVFNKHSGRLTGFVDLGDVNRDMEQLLGLEQDDSSSRLADQKNQ